MTNGNLVSYQSIVDKFYRDFSGLNFTLTDEQSLEWIAEFMALANSPIVLTSKNAVIEIVDGRGKLPNDLHLIIQTAMAEQGVTKEDLECGKGRLYPLRWATDHFHTRHHSCDADFKCTASQTYQVNNNYIFTSTSKGFVVMAYRAIPTDVDGYPMIPGDQPWLEGATKFLAGKVAAVMWQRGDLNDNKLYHFERERDWYFTQAVNYSKMPSLDQMESFKNDRISMIPRINDHSTFFKNFQMPEQRHWRKNYDGS